MLFYNFNSLDNFIKTNFIENTKLELDRLDIIFKIYEDKKNNLDSISINFVGDSINMSDENSDILFSTSTLLKNSYKNLENIKRSIIHLKDTLTNIISLYNKNLDSNYDEIKAELIEYNTQSDGLYYQIFDFENNLSSIISNILENSSIDKKNIKKAKKNSLKSEDSDISFNLNTDNNPQDKNILIISEKDQKAYLPYKYNTLKAILDKSNGKYKDLQDIIDTFFTLPLNRFKNSSISRFRESFYLIRYKEKGSISKALDLASELMFKHELNPIIIAACRNLDELDIYLDCLDEKELNQFDCFEIRYEVCPKNIWI